MKENPPKLNRRVEDVRDGDFSMIMTREEFKKKDGIFKNKNNIGRVYSGDAKNEIYFGILFKDGDEKKTFYPDFIVKYKDGRIGIFDTKMGGTAKSEDTKLKANALAKYVEE
jgi:type III restriction enzyme